MQPGEAAALLREDGDGALRDMVVGYGSDNQGVQAVINRGGSGNLEFNSVVKRIWRWLLARGTRLEVKWSSGLHMVATGTDALSRQKWSRACDWTFFPRVIHDLRRWVRRWGQPSVLFTKDVVSGAAYGFNSSPGSVPIVFPGGNHIAEFVGHLRQRRCIACVVVPRWHGPAMAAVAKFTVASCQLGPAYAVFRSPSRSTGGRRSRIPAWMMQAVVLDFTAAGTAADQRAPRTVSFDLDVETRVF
eukprot:COSAG02_NODE_12087_length_1599_cov_384.894000_1_plen_245_part_10